MWGWIDFPAIPYIGLAAVNLAAFSSVSVRPMLLSAARQSE
jgi:hypothetical protein